MSEHTESQQGQKGFFVSSGSYSDYSVVAMFTTRDKAEAFVAAHQELGSLYRNGAGEWVPPKYHYDDYQVEECDLDLVFGAVGCYSATVTVEGTQHATIPPWSKSEWEGSSYWVEDRTASDPAVCLRNPFHGNTSVTGYGATRDEAFASASALRDRILSGEVDAPWPDYYKGPR